MVGGRYRRDLVEIRVNQFPFGLFFYGMYGVGGVWDVIVVVGVARVCIIVAGEMRSNSFVRSMVQRI